MNAAGRLAHSSHLVRPLLLVHAFSKKQSLFASLVVLVMISALATVYTTETVRVSRATYQHGLYEIHRLQIQKSALLLERSVWTSPERVQSIAKTQLNMVMPTHDSTVLVRV